MKFSNKTSLSKSIIFIGSASLFSSVAKFLLTLVLLRYLSPEEFGLWASLTSIAAILMFGDLGVGNALRNKLSDLNERHPHNKNLQREYYYTAVYAFIFIACLGSTLVFFFGDSLPIEKLFNSDNVTILNQGTEIVEFLILFFFASLPFGIANGLFYSYGESKILALITLATSFVSLLIGVLMVKYTEADVDALFRSQYFVVFVSGFLSTLVFMHRRKWLYSVLVDLKAASNRFFGILKGGLLFMGNDISASFLINSPTIFIAAMVDLKTAAVYSLLQKIFTFTGGLIQTMLNPVWARLATLKARGASQQAIQIANMTSIITGCLFFIITIIVCINIDLILVTLAGTDYSYGVDVQLVFFVGLTYITYVIYDSISLIQKSFGALRLRLSIQCFAVLLLTPVMDVGFSAYGVVAIPVIMVGIWISLSLMLLIQRASLTRDANENLNCNRDVG
jgi:O-antigen/teichoic acid export membrane protein